MATYGAKNYFTLKNIIIYIVAAIIVYGAIYYFFLKKGGSSSPYNYNSNTNYSTPAPK